MSFTSSLRFSNKDYFLILVFSLFASFILGSRLSYFFVVLNGRYFPEPFLILFLIYLTIKNKILFKSFILIGVPWFIFITISFLLSESATINVFFAQNYANLRATFFGLIVPFAAFLSFRRATLDLRVIQKILLFLNFFSIFSLLMGIYSINIPEPEGISILSSYGGLRSIQSFLAPSIFHISAMYMEVLIGKFNNRRIFLITIVSVIMCLSCFYYGLSRIALMPIPFAIVSSLVVLINNNKIPVRIFTLFRALIILIISSPLIVFLASQSISLMSNLSSNVTVDTTATLTGTWHKIDIIDSALARLTLNSGESSIRFYMILTIILNPFLFLMPRSVEISQLDEIFLNIFNNTFPYFDGYFLSLADSGLVYLICSFGLILSLFFASKFFKIVALNVKIWSNSDYRKFSSPIISSQLIWPIYFVFTLFSTAPIFNMFLGCSFGILLFLITLMPRLIANSLNSGYLRFYPLKSHICRVQ